MRSEPAIPRVLIADDQPDVLEALRLLLKGEGYKMESAGSPAAILEAIDGDEFDAVLMDLNYARDTTSGQEGLDLLSQLRSRDATLPVIVMTAWGSVEVAVEAMRRGARDFVQKPWENARLLRIVRTQVELARALRRQQKLEAENRSLKPDTRPLLIAEAVSMRLVLELISRVGPSEANVLVTGENGTGKGTVAQALPPGSPVPPQHDRNPAAAAPRAARGHSGAGDALPAPAHAAVPQEPHRLRRRRAPGAARSPVARQHPRARSRRRARRADGARRIHPPRRAGAPHRSRRDLARRGHEPRGRRRVPDQESDGAVRRQRQPGRQGARAQP